MNFPAHSASKDSASNSKPGFFQKCTFWWVKYSFVPQISNSAMARYTGQIYSLTILNIEYVVSKKMRIYLQAVTRKPAAGTKRIQIACAIDWTKWSWWKQPRPTKSSCTQGCTVCLLPWKLHHVLWKYTFPPWIIFLVGTPFSTLSNHPVRTTLVQYSIKRHIVE